MPQGAGWAQLLSEVVLRQCHGGVPGSPTELCCAWQRLLPNTELLMLPGLLPGEAEISAWKCCKLSLFQWIPEECMGFFPWLCTLVSLQQRWKKAIQMSSPSLLSLPGSQVKKDLFMTVLIFSVTFYWAPVLSWDRELVSLLFLVWSDKLVPLPWDWTMDKNQFSFNKLQQFAFSFSCCLYWFPEFSETLSILLRSRFIWKGTVMMATVPQESVFCLLLALLRAKPRRFIPSVVVCRETLEEFTALRHDSSELLSLQLSHLSGPAKEKGNLLWGKKQKHDSFFLMVF